MQCVIAKNRNLPKSKKLVNSLALLAPDKFMPKMHLDNLDLHIVLADNLQKTKK